jgi:hypothetical protein
MRCRRAATAARAVPSALTRLDGSVDDHRRGLWPDVRAGWGGLVTAEARSLARVVVLVSIAAAGWLLFTDVHRFQLSDSLLPALVSLQAWTPFFWGRERLGML